MKSKESTSIPIKYKLLHILLCLIGTCMILFATNNYGVGISPDSVGYIATARHIADGMGFISYDNAPLIVQPPLYPAILAAIYFVFRIDPLLSANIVSAVLFGLSLYLSGLLFFKYLISSPNLALLGMISLLVSIPLVKVSFWAWSELTFIFFVVLYFVSISIYSERKNLKSLFLLSLSVALACLTRYIGVIFILTGIISIWLICKGGLKTKLSHVVFFIFVAVLPIGIWVGRNYLISETLFGTRSLSLYSLSDNIIFSFDTISQWFLPYRITYSRPILMLLSFMAGFIIGVLIVWSKASIKTALKRSHAFKVSLLLVVIVYLAFLIITSTTTHFDRINDRLLSPIFMPLTLLLFSVIEIMSKLIKEHFRTKSVGLLIMASIALWLIYPTRATVLNVVNQFNQGIGYSARTWKNSQTIQYVRENNLTNCDIYSNGADVFYLLLNMNVKSIPSKSSGANVIADISSLISFPQENKACLVWFNQIGRKYLFTPDELMSVTNLQKAINLDDGTIYFVSKK